MYSITILGKEHITNSDKEYNRLCESLERIEWMKMNGNDFPLAASKFFCNEQTLRRGLNKLGYKPGPKRNEQQTITDNGILTHMETGDINDYCKEHNIDKRCLTSRMNNRGYSLTTGSYSLTVRVHNLNYNSKKKPIIDIYDKILYNKILSYCEGFKLHQPFSLRG